MSRPEQFDTLILGSGKSGKLLAWHMAQSGRRAAVVERRWIGGSCPNIACLPSKNEIWSARVAHLAREGARFGVVTGPVTTDMATVVKRKRDMVQREIEAHLHNYKTTGAELIMGNGHFVAPKTRQEDPDVAAEMQRILGDEGIQFLLAAQALNVYGRSGGDVRVTLRTPSGNLQIEGSDILVAAGRSPNTKEIGLEQAGVALDTRGYIRVNERLETTAPEVWAMGDCAGSPQFTHVAGDDFRIVRDNLAGGMRSTRDRLVPYCMFTDPQLAHVGLSERDAQREGIATRVAKLPMSAVLRTEATDETQGFMKAIVGRDDDRILGFTMIGAEAGEVMAAVQTAILAKLPYQTLRDAILTHPTMAEGLGSLFENVPPRSVSAKVEQPLAATA